MNASNVRSNLISVLLLLTLIGCSPSQAQLDAQSTQAALEIFTTQTQAAEHLHATQTAAVPTSTPTEIPTKTPTHTPIPTPTPTPIPSSPGIYHSQQYPFSIEYPSEWLRLPGQAGITAAYGDLNTGEGIYIAEEDLNEIGLGDASLREYVDVIIFIISQTEGYELISDEQVSNANGLPVEILDFHIGPDGSLHGRRLIYVHENLIGFSASYIAFEGNFMKLQPTIEASFDSFRVTE
jgi:hypothetical protein